ncbi:MAG: LemA family protein [Bdellovibrio sp.]
MSGPFLIGFCLAIVAFFIIIYNKLVQLRNLVKNSFSQIDVQLKRRYDLIPNLVETAKAYMKHEEQTLEKVVWARNQALGAHRAASQNPADSQNMKNLLHAEGQLGQALSQLMVVVESYPDLKANANLMQVTEELTTTENKISFARQAYNDAVMDYNNHCQMFPHNIVAGTFSFKEAASFEITSPNERNTVRVSFE